MKRFHTALQIGLMLTALALFAFAQPTPPPSGAPANNPVNPPAPSAGHGGGSAQPGIGTTGATGTSGYAGAGSGSAVNPSDGYRRDQDKDRNFGWIGLLGLAGLAGLFRTRHAHD